MLVFGQGEGHQPPHPLELSDTITHLALMKWVVLLCMTASKMGTYSDWSYLALGPEIVAVR